jgi:hypothetical protein
MNYIESSKTIQEFLKKNDIKIEVDVHAPVVIEAAEPNDLGRRLFVAQKGTAVLDGLKIAYPYYGPGGEGNLLKAFVVLHQAGIASIQALRTSGNGESYIHIVWRKDTGVSMWINEEVYTENIHITLHDLLYKIATVVAAESLLKAAKSLIDHRRRCIDIRLDVEDIEKAIAACKGTSERSKEDE